MKLPILGQCQCGQAKFSISEFPLTFYACHCTECQKQSASAFGLSLWAEKPAFHVSGDTRKWSRKADSGNVLHCHFCPQCGTRIWHEGDVIDPALGPIVSIKAGSIVQMAGHKPIGHIWTKSKHVGTEIPRDVLNFEKSAPSSALLIDAWQKYFSSL